MFFDQGNGWDVELSGCHMVRMVTSKGKWNWDIQSNWDSSVDEELTLGFPTSGYSSVSYCRGGGRSEPQTLSRSPGVCVRVCKTSHCVCCVPCCVHLWTDSHNNLKIEKAGIMAKDTPPPLFVRVLVMTFIARPNNVTYSGAGCPWKKWCVDLVRKCTTNKRHLKKCGESVY